MKRKFKCNRKGISTIIATIIIVAISITMAIAVAYWAMGIGNSFTKFEKLEFVSIFSDTVTQNPANGVRATANTTLDALGSVTAVNILNGGSGYTVAPTVTISPAPAGGTTATAFAQISNQAVSNIIITNPGSGYITNPTVTVGQPTFSSYAINIQIKNSGTASATINNVFINGRPLNAAGAGAWSPMMPNGAVAGSSIAVGARLLPPTSMIYLPSGGTYNSGDYVEIELETTAGRTYSNTVTLP